MPKIIPQEKLEQATRMLREGKPLKAICQETGLGSTKVRELAAVAGIQVPKGKPGRPKGSGAKSSPKPSDGTSSGTSSSSSVSSSTALPVQAAPGAPLQELVAQHPGSLPFPAGPLPGAPEAVQAAPSAPLPSAAPVAPPIDGETLYAIVTVTKATVVGNVALVYGLELTAEQTERLCGFTAQEEKALRTLAPHAAAYTGGLEKYARGAMAVLFVAMVGASTARSVKELQGMRPKKPATGPHAIKPEAKPAKKPDRKKSEPAPIHSPVGPKTPVSTGAEKPA